MGPGWPWYMTNSKLRLLLAVQVVGAVIIPLQHLARVPQASLGPTWTPEVGKITAQNSLKVHYFTYFWGSGRAYNVESRLKGLGFSFCWGVEFRFQALEFRVWSRALCLRLRVQSSSFGAAYGLKVHSVGICWCSWTVCK